MFDSAVIARLRDAVTRVTGVALPETIVCQDGDGLSVHLERADGALTIAAEDRSALCRGMTLAAQAIREDRLPLAAEQARGIRSLGPMLDMSRGAVMTVEAVKRYVDITACLGMNLMMLYTEDVYEVPEYPYFGYLRGRYTRQELREIDDYADSMGVELVPCIQTLAHLGSFLQWAPQADLIDQPTVMMVGEEKVYAFIEAAIRSISGCMRSRRIHIGMDEAHGIGLGRYLEQHGAADRFSLLYGHLQRVADICRKYRLEPIMWSDMFFRLASKRNEYYDMDAVVPQRVIDMIPDGVGLCYWDYYHTDRAVYEHMLAQHARMGGRTSFAGGAWTWSGFLPQVKRTLATMVPALQSCAAHGIDTVLATMWGDDGAETNLLLAAGLLPVFSEFCWRGPDCALAEVESMGALIAGLPWDAYAALGEFYPDERDVRTGKALVWCDPLYPLVNDGRDTMDAAIARAQAALDRLRPHAGRLDVDYAVKLFEVTADKAALLRDLRPRYLAGDRAWLSEAANVRLPALIERYEALTALHRALWNRDNKRNGWEVLARRYGGTIGRLKDVRQEMLDWLDGKVDRLPELDEEPLNSARANGWQNYGSLIGALATIV